MPIDKFDASGTSSYYTDTKTDPRCVSPDTMASVEHTVGSDSFVSQGDAHPNYLNELLEEKKELKTLGSHGFKYILQLIDNEIARVLESITEPEEYTNRGRVTLSEVIMVPVDQYPNYNFVGRLLGPRGMTARQLEVETGCRILVRGRGSSRVGKRRNLMTDDPIEPLHVVIECEDFEPSARKKLTYAVELLNKMIHPPPEGHDELKRKQLVDLSIINGTYRPTHATKNMLRAPDFSPNSQHPVSDRLRSRRPSVDRESDNLKPFFDQAIQTALSMDPLVAAEYYRNLMLSSVSEPSLIASPASSTSSIHPATPVDYAKAISMLRNFDMCAAGDGPTEARWT